MCRTEPQPQPQPRVLCPVPANITAADMPSHQLTRSMKPRLPRKLAASARINLNKYWHALEELMPVSRKVFDESDCNAINENLDNERRLAAMQLADGLEEQGPESPETLVGRYDHSENVSSLMISCQDLTSPSGAPFSSLTDNNTICDESSFPQISNRTSVLMASDRASVPVMAPFAGDENQPPNCNGCMSFLR